MSSLPYFHNRESTLKILWTQQKKKEKKKGHDRLGKLVLDSSMVKKTAVGSKTKGKKLNPHATYVVNICQ